MEQTGKPACSRMLSEFAELPGYAFGRATAVF
jgi:hypothetical protein